MSRPSSLSNRLALIPCLVGAGLSFAWAMLGERDVNVEDPRIARISAAEVSSRSNPSATLNSLCDAEELAREIVSERPLSSVVLLQYAGVRSLLGSATCSASTSTDSIFETNELIDFAIARSPHSKGALLAAAMISRRQSEEDRRAQFLRHALLTPGDFTHDQLNALRQELDSGSLIEEAVPPDFRSVVLVSNLKREPRTAIIDQFPDLQVRSAIRSLQSQLLEYTGASLSRRELERLAQLAAGADILARIDSIRADKARADIDLSAREYFANRSALRLTPIVTGVLYNDSNPELGSVSRWRKSDSIAFDDTGVSVVGAVPDSTIVRGVQLSSIEPNALLSADEVQIWASADDMRWSRVNVERSFSVLDSGTTSLLLRVSPPPSTKFIKARFAVPVHRKRFKDPLFRLLQVYSDA